MPILNKNLKGFKDTLGSYGGDISKSYLFTVEIPFISTIGERSVLTAFARSTDVPSFDLSMKPVDLSFIRLNLVDGVEFKGTWTLSVLSDEDSILRSSFLAWSCMAFDFNRKASATPLTYKKEIIVNQLNIKGLPICSYRLYGVVPKTVGAYTISNDSNDIIKFDVSFAYDYYKVNVVSNETATQSAINRGGITKRVTFVDGKLDTNPANPETAIPV